METVLFNIAFFLILIFFYQRTKHGLHILQLENYYNDRYAVWLKRYIKKVLNIKIMVLLLIPIILFLLNENIWALSLEIVALIALILTFRKPTEKKAFVVTSRIKRMYCTYILFFLIILLLANVTNYKIILSITNVFAMISYTFVYVVNLINRPIEKCIRRGFIKKASQKLKEMPNLKVIGVTGSYGKTSTKYIVSTILSQKYNTLMTPESYNTTMGVVRTINEKLMPTHNAFVCEMGAKYIGDIKEICDIVNPKYGILTAIGPQHLDTFKSLDNVRKTKLELVNSLPDNGIAFVNWEDENIQKSKITKNMIKYGLSKNADYYAKNIEINERWSTFDVVIPGKDSIKIKTKLLGKLNVLNIVGAVAIADKLGLSEDEIKIGVKYIKPVTHRLELKQNANGSIIIDDAYNSNIKGAEMALEVLKEFKNRQRILITPGIVELGDKSEEINSMLGQKAAKSSDFIILVGEEQAKPIYKGIQKEKFSKDKVFIAKNLDEALKKMNEIITNNSVVLLENDLPDNYL